MKVAEYQMPVDTPAYTTAAAQVIQDALLRRLPPAEKLAQVARLSRVADLLSIEGLARHAEHRVAVTHPVATRDPVWTIVGAEA
jgi:hypothetical protein